MYVFRILLTPTTVTLILLCDTCFRMFNDIRILDEILTALLVFVMFNKTVVMFTVVLDAYL